MTGYIHQHGGSTWHAHAGRNLANSAPHLLTSLKPGLRVLDVGAGSGTLTRDIAARVAPGEVVGVDVAPQAVEGAQAEPDRPANLTFQVADAYALPFPDASFDVVHAHQVLHHLADPPAAIREMLRVARPGGLVALREADYGAAFWYPDATAWRAWQQSYQLLAGGGGTEVDAGRRLPSWLDQAKVAGQVRFSGTLWTYPGFAPAAEIANSWADRLTERRFVDLATGTGVADEASLVRAATGLIEWARHPNAFFAMPHVEAIIDLT